MLLLFAPTLWGQNVRKIEIVNTDSLVFAESTGRNLKRLYGNVAFKHEGVLMYCDSAYFYSIENEFDAYSNVHIKHSDTLNLYGDSLHFEGNNNIAQMRGNVKMVDNNTVLTTHFLDYDIKNNVGYYYNGGKIVDNENTLVSEIGRYYEQTKELFFKDSVLLVSPDYTIETDTLKYNTTSNIAFFFGPSNIISDENLLYTENGWYNTSNETAEFYAKSYVNAGDRFVWADTLNYNRNTSSGWGHGNVLMKDTLQNILLYGQKAEFTEKPEYCFVTDSVLMIKAFQFDSLFMHSDSIVCEKVIPEGNDSLSYRLLKAYNKVRFFKPDLRGKCDSLVYNFRDSIVELHHDPVIWAENNQITGEEIKLHVSNDEVDRVYINTYAFIISEEGNNTFNQVKGANMIGYIKNSELYKLEVIRNGETVYFMRDEKDLIGISKAECQKIIVYFENSEISEITFLKKPVGTLFPPEQLTIDQRTLTDFRWMKEIRPTDKMDVFNWR